MAFLGAYFVTLGALFRRFLRRDLSARAFMSVTMRLVLATLGVWVLVAYLDGAQPPAQVDTGVAPGEAFALEIKASVGPEAAAAAGAVEVASLPEWLGPRVQPQPGGDSDSDTEAGLGLCRLQDALEARLGAAGKLQTVQRVSPSGVDWGMELEASLSGMVAAGLGPMLGADEDAALQEALALAWIPV